MTPAKALQYNTVYNIVNTPITMWPWPHLRIEKIFPEVLYKKIIENIPDVNQITGVYKNKNDNNYQKNRYFLCDEDIERIESSKKYFWKNFKIMMTDGILQNYILEKIKQIVINDRDENIFESHEIYDTCNLTLDKPGFGLAEHTDVPEKVFTFVINLAHNCSNLNLGTNIIMGPDIKENNDNFNANYEKLELCNKIKFTENSAVGVIKTKNSWHSVDEVKENRWTIQYTIWAKPKNDT